MRAVFLDYATVDAGDLDPANLDRALPDLTRYEVSRDDEVIPRIKDAQIVLVNKIHLDAERIDAAPSLELICLAGTGTNHINLEAARRRGIAVVSIRRYCTASVVEHVFAMVFALTRHLGEYQRLMEQGAWRDSPQLRLLDYPIRELRGGEFGIVGLGELGRAVGQAAQCLGMHVLIANQPGGARVDGRLDLDELLKRVDVLSLHCPLTPATEGLIGARELALMKPDSVLINTARGGLVDSGALAAALRAGSLGGAGIDVLPQEPPLEGNPLLSGDIPNLIVTPHIAWAARQSRQRAIDEMATNIEDYLRGGHRGRVI